MLVEPIEKYLKGNTELYRRIRMVLPEGIIAGGAARQIFLGERFGSTDIDFYFPTWGVCDVWNNNLYRQGYRQYQHSRNAVGYENIFDTKCQLISKIYSDDPQVIFNSFDFTCCMFAIKDDQLYFTNEAAEHATKKMLVIADINNYTYGRIGKYLRKGYYPGCPLTNEIFDEFVKYIHECEEGHPCNGFGPIWKDIPELEKNIENIFIGFFGISTEDDY